MSGPNQEALLPESSMVRFLDDKMIPPRVRFLNDLTGWDQRSFQSLHHDLNRNAYRGSCWMCRVRYISDTLGSFRKHQLTIYLVLTESVAFPL